MPAPCLPDQAAALLRLKHSFNMTNKSECTLASWRAGTDCCRWEGVRCGVGIGVGHVTSLDLGECGLESAALDPALFELTSLRHLNLAWNNFSGSHIPTIGFERLTELTYLNLSNSKFAGQIPNTIGRLTNLISLDLSTDFFLIDLDDEFLSVATYSPAWLLVAPNIVSIVANLHNLKELYMGTIDLSSNSMVQWCSAFSNSTTPQLQVLSLPYCYLEVPICESLSGIRSLSEINLQYNFIHGPIPESFGDLPSLSVLSLTHNSLEGSFPSRIFQNKNLTSVDVRYNFELSGSLPKNISSNDILVDLLVSSTNFSGPIPNSVGNIKSLENLGVASSDFSQELPSSIGQLRSLNSLEITGAGVVGAVPSWIANLTSLTLLDFSNCGLSGKIPSAIGAIKNLKRLALYKCNFSGQIPQDLFNLTQLRVIYLQYNNFIGTLELSSFWKLPDLFSLNLSNNKLSVVDGEKNNSSWVSINYFYTLRLAYCNISNFPSALSLMPWVGNLDLSGNQIHGTIPQWAWETSSELFILNLLHNKFDNIGYNYLPFYLEIVDLSYNLFQGPIPITGPDTWLLDCSNNRFSSMPFNFSSQLSGMSYLMASRNNLSGEIPLSICDARDILLLDLSYNNLSGLIPLCLLEDINSLSVFNLKANQLHGELPRNIKKGCALEALDFSENMFEGQLPTSLVACRDLEVLDIGNNQISGGFPCWASMLPKLQVLVLKSNKFTGEVGSSAIEKDNTCEFANLRILDLASNNFSGTLHHKWLKRLKSMMETSSSATLLMQYQHNVHSTTYQFSTSIAYKGYEVTFTKILRTLVVIDVSDNALHGSIPKSIGELVLLRGLNMSHNALTGPIPSQLGALHELESLDLSSNDLSGEIPQELAQLHFLSVLNLSYNGLVGRIPDSPQFSNNLSYLGNIGLCGFPLSKECSNMTTPPSSHPSEEKHVDVILFLFVGLGVGIGFAVIIVVTWGIRIKKRSQDSRFPFWKKVLCM
ncbi:putative verticillium wilt disease resistance protein [Oryza sativa Japonica Group]|nr:hypothetical protein OsJ_00467 [Oryza sativa Japonica Group]BAA96770.1 putative verticillium wilt disease resistance protein [Oryza sativa Japonica Group]BAB08209.1 unnamed protein product [Oryza sativa Japonica Group]